MGVEIYFEAKIPMSKYNIEEKCKTSFNTQRMVVLSK